MNVPRHGSRRRRAPFLWFLPAALSAEPAAAQSRTSANIDVAPELVGVLMEALVPHRSTAPGGTERLLRSLVADPLVSAVLLELGAKGLTPRAPSVPSAADLQRLQAAMAGGAPGWLAEAIQRSVENDLPGVTPLNVLLVLAPNPDPATTAFMDRHGVNGTRVAAFAGEVLREMGEAAG